jgi:ABC-type Fe3+-hydroxamate transport system substrate-binding protein
MLKDEQIWENDESIIKIEQMGESIRGFIFRKGKDGSLKFISAIFDRPKQVEQLIEELKMKLTNKFLTLDKTRE